jgi:transposase
MEVVHPRVAGIDVHKKVIWVAVRLPGQGPGQRTVTVRRFKTFWRSLQKMAVWLAELGVTDAAMESTGVYWWPVYHALAQAGIEVCVCNAAHMRNVPGRKRDVTDCQWIAELHEYGLLRASFIPDAQVAALRQRTRYRKKLIEQRTSEGQRLAKVLEDAGIKIDSVASKLLIKSGRKMIEALISGERNPGRLADLAEGVLRRKTEELQMACDGRFAAGHGQMCRLHLDAYDRLTAQIAGLDALVAEAAASFAAIIARLVTIPGIGQRTAEVIIAETRRRHGPVRHRGPAGGLGRTGARRQRVRRQAQEGAHPPGRPAAAHGHGGSGLGDLAHRHPPRRPVPPPWPAGSARVTRRRPRSPSRTPCCASPGRSCATTPTTSTPAPTTTSGATSATASTWSATTRTPWPGSESRSS